MIHKSQWLSFNSYDGVYPTPVGWLGYKVEDDQLVFLRWWDTFASAKRAHRRVDFVHTALEEYFRFGRPVSNIPFHFVCGTVFQQRVWQAIYEIPFGVSMSYGELARQLNTSSRAIGGACRCNMIALLVPCHRVVAANGIGGYIGKSHSHIKQWLLNHEKSNSADISRSRN